MKALTLSSRTFAWILSLSLLLNAFLLAWAGVRWFRPEPHPRFTMEFLEQRFAARLPERDAAIFRKALEIHRAELSARMDAARRSRDSVREVLTAEPFQPSRLAAALDDSQAAMDRFHAEFRAVILSAAPELSPEGRQRLFERREP